ncbi:plasma membrane channel protein [Grosmannia clavigera kw1407]|uniref:Plasma membrane channel protein n=1 Tax=Grosmannia clavigera (strain kw1407 / UAMH 11150) TaxID=655863 RepID=F0XFJ8_GROCL|nr:plasma membrane channel protein [Grosmannia clavigera kw1407]EFX04153.1 plasma membrane channel protein [Grosmannia clavigera kw1407]
MATASNTQAHESGSDTNSNYGVDYVIHFLVPEKERNEAEAAFVQLIEALAAAGFATEVRAGADKGSLLVFTRLASAGLLRTQVYRSRLQDWLYGIRTQAPPSRKTQGGRDVDLAAYFADEPISEAERLRLIYLLLTRSRSEGGAGITPPGSDALAGGSNPHRFVAGLFPLHDHAFNRAWIKQWGTKYMLDATDLDSIRDKFGERVAFYFAFLQSYFAFLLFPAAFGFGAWLLFGQFSWFYAVVNCLWSVVFFEYWKKKEVDLAVQWGVRGVSQIQLPRPQFRFDREAKDPVTGESVKIYSPFRRLSHQLLQVPFALACVAALGSLIALCFAIEIFITEVYSGPFKQYLTFLPTILLTGLMPVLTGVLSKVAERLTVLENYATQDTHQAGLVQKIFVINFITSYLPIFLTAFVYVPFGKVLVPYLDVFQITAQRLTGDNKTETAAEVQVTSLPPPSFQINPDRLTKQVIYFTVTAQVVNFLLEAVVPYAKRRVFKVVKEEMTSRSGQGVVHEKDAPEESAFLERVRNEAELGVYDVTIDYREMVVQFGYLALFSAIWPLTACSFLINNWVEARSDAMKIAIGSQRPIPWRADSIGPWLAPLGFLSWLGSLTSAAVVYLFRSDPHGPDGEPWNIRGWALLLSILVAEHLYLVVQLVVRYVVDKMDSPGLQKERAERFALRKNVLAESLGVAEAEAEAQLSPVASNSPAITRDVLEEDLRQTSIQSQGSPEALFWLRQRGASETIQIGRGLISEVS